MGSVVLLSGGLDSAVCLRIVGPVDACLFVDYGQPAVEQERAASQRLAKEAEVPWHELQLNLPLGEMAAPAGEPGPRIVPGRNLAMLSCAVSFAAGLGSDAVVFGASLSDRRAYPDCRGEWLNDVSRVCEAAYGIEIAAPLQYSTRAQVCDIARETGVNATSVWSCYTPVDGKPCGTCDSCKQPGLR
jgi:7-cyano-7-deazaguanine synthase